MSDESHEAIVVVETPSATVEPHEPEPIGLGQWYWVRYKNGEFLECCTHVGSNFAEMTGVNEASHRIHFDDFDKRCRRAPNASEVIAGKVAGHQQEVQRLMGEVQALTARLGVGQTPALSAEATEGAALAKLDSNQNVGAYKAQLVKAKEKDLPELFRAIEQANSKMAMWMKAETLPMTAQVGQMKGAIRRIDDRIFNVELYAGLVEQVAQIAEGEPAAMTEKVRLMQRRHYMDEECLARYRTGGMEFDNIDEFDDWIADEVNRDRLLPFPRCIVAFRVRRHTKQRAVPRGFIKMFEYIMTIGSKIEADRMTFLYIRNGDNLYRLSTELEFGSRLFPDTDHHALTAGTQLWAEVSGNSVVGSIITEHRYQGLLEDYARAKAEYEAKKKAHPAKVKAWRAAKKAAKKARVPFTQAEPYLGWFSDQDPKGRYEPYDANNIHYDDIQKKIAREIQQANRIAIIIQGLLDRSHVLHPHPPWKIWAEGGAEQALELIYDDSRALAGGEQPDFEAYRQRLNRSLRAGCITVGQQAAWSADTHEDDDYGGYRHRGRRRRSQGEGPGVLARVVGFQRRAQKCTYAWNRRGESANTWDKQIRCQYTCVADRVLNVDAYQPGDFKQFFADPRTRADYLKWAPLLLEAEEFHAGNREIKEPPVAVKREGSSYEGRKAYQRRKARLQLLDKAVRLVRDVTTQGGTKYKKGSLWRVLYIDRGLTIARINDDGTRIDNGGTIRCMEYYDLEEDPSIPPDPPKATRSSAPEPDDDDDDFEPDDGDEDPETDDFDDEDDDSEAEPDDELDTNHIND